MLLRSVQHTPMSLAETIRLYGRAFRSRAITERDLRSFRRSYGDVLGPTPAPTGGAALIASLSYSPFQLKLEGMFAKAFQLQGSSRCAAVPSDCRAAARATSSCSGSGASCGSTDYLHARARGRGASARARSCSGVRDAGRPAALTFRGVDVGRQALSTVSRYLHEGGVDLADATARALLRAPAAVGGEDRARVRASARRRCSPSSCSSTSGTTRTRARSATSRSAAA